MKKKNHFKNRIKGFYTEKDLYINRLDEDGGSKIDNLEPMQKDDIEEIEE